MQPQSAVINSLINNGDGRKKSEDEGASPGPSQEDAKYKLALIYKFMDHITTYLQ